MNKTSTKKNITGEKKNPNIFPSTGMIRGKDCSLLGVIKIPPEPDNLIFAWYKDRNMPEENQTRWVG